MNLLERQADAESASRQTMSALADAQPDAVDAALALWGQDAQARRAWHEYQLIGDVLRSDELAADAVRDEALLLAVRARLADEPAIVAPLAAAADGRSRSALVRRRWSVAAVAAGFLMVAGVVSVLQAPADNPSLAGQAPATGMAGLSPRDGAGAIARVRSPAGLSAAVQPASSEASAAGAIGADPQWRMLDGKIIRDARLDAYLRAHRGSGAVSGRFETVVLDR